MVDQSKKVKLSVTNKMLLKIRTIPYAIIPVGVVAGNAITEGAYE